MELIASHFSLSSFASPNIPHFDSICARMDDLSLLLLGTGTSSCVPSVACLTANESSKPGCYCCLSTTDPTNPHGHRNIRRNTAALLSIPSQVVGERRRSLLIDCGKSFYAAALEHWPKRGLREIDAVLLTHPHAVRTTSFRLR